MYKIIDGRGTGKTEKLLQLARKNNGIVVCSNPYAMLNKAHAYGMVGIDCISYHDFLAQNEKPQRPIYIDEATALLQYIDSNVDGFTLSND